MVMLNVYWKGIKMGFLNHSFGEIKISPKMVNKFWKYINNINKLSIRNERGQGYEINSKYCDKKYNGQMGTSWSQDGCMILHV